MVVKKPDGTARLCVDYSTGLNDAVQLHQHPLSVTEDISSIINGVHVFSQIDFSGACLKVELDDDSKRLCNINTHQGVYEYQRLTFGVKSAPDIFQAIMDNMLAGLPFAAAYMNDIVVVSRSPDGRRRHLHAVFDIINEYVFRVRLRKCSFFQTCIKYLRFIVDKDERRPYPKKITAIANMPASTIITLRSSLGQVSYYQSFIPDMRVIRQPLDDLP